MRVLLLNQFLPPDPAPTACLIGDVAEKLRERGNETVLVGNCSDYHGKKTLFGSRRLREAVGLGRLLFRGWAARRCDVIFFLSSPPFLPVVAKMISWRHPGARMVHWAMDIYPEVAIALGETNPRSWIARITGRLMGHVYRSCDAVIALDEDMANVLERYGVDASIQPPWPHDLACSRELSSASEGRFRILYSGNLGRAHDWKTILDALLLLQAEGCELEMVFQGGGAERDCARRYAEEIGLRGCEWKPYVEQEELLSSLLSANILLITQREETRGCLWPSKLALSALTGIPLLWIGPRDGATSRKITRDRHHAFTVGASEEVSVAIHELYRNYLRAGRPGNHANEVIAEAAKQAEAGRSEICRLIDSQQIGAP